METKFQTSFIPKKPISTIGGPTVAPTKHRGASWFMTFSVLVFILSLAAVGGAYAWKQVLVSAQAGYKTQLAERQKQFNVDLISQLKEANVKIDIAKTLLRNHVAMSQIFGIISRITIENVRFLSMDVSGPKKAGGDLTVTLAGYGSNLSAVAFQSDVLNQLEQYGLRKIVKNPILSDPSLNTNGTVSFGFTASIDPSSLSYENIVSPQSASSTGQAN